MSSVQSYLRQRVVGTTTFAAPATPTSMQLYEFVAGNGAAGTTALAAVAAGNYVGNYPPGYLVVGPLVSALKVAAQGGLVNPILRDLGKTIYAPLGSPNSGPTLPFGTAGYWRAVQVLDPSLVTTGNSGVTGALPGVKPFGSNSGDKGYNTYYIPIVVNGLAPSDTAGVPLVPTNATMLLGGVM